MSVIDELNALLDGQFEVTFEDTWELLRQRITVLSERVWEGRNKWPEVEAWLANFDGRSGLAPEIEKLHALFLLSQFLFIGSDETRVLLHAVFRDLFLIPLVQEVRAGLNNTRDFDRIASGVAEALSRTRFLGVGNPSESGVHLLYFFRQESGLTSKQFPDPAAMFVVNRAADGTLSQTLGFPDVDRYVFVDDVCGSGAQIVNYSKTILSELVALKPDVKLQYLSMFACESGLDRVREDSVFGNNCAAVFELDETYRALSDRARILRAAPPNIDGATLRHVALTYGQILQPDHPGGYDDNQLLLGFHHNTPDNTLPILWFEGTPDCPWTPAFRRYPKI